MPRLIGVEEVAKHNTKEDCWVILSNKVYNLTEFVNEHPGGPEVLKKFAGKDGTALFDKVHPKDTLEKYARPEWFVGDLDTGVAKRLLTYDEVTKHNTKDDCWIILGNKVFNFTDFVQLHPGGPEVIIKFAGKDGTKVFENVHPKDTLEKHAKPEWFMGELDPNTIPQELKDAANKEEEEERARRANVPPLSQCLNLRDFELVAKKVLTPEAWAYYSSAADDQETYHENTSIFRRIWFRPRVLRNVRNVDPSTYILGFPSPLPIYITATALGRLGHPDGELNLTRAAARTGLIQMVPTLSSCSFEEIVGGRDEEGKPTQFFQLYVNSDRSVVLDMLRRAEEADIKAIFITVDAPQLGRRERDMRMHFSDEGSNVQSGNDVERDEGAARAISSFIDPSLTWDDVLWIKNHTRIPILLKGVQAWEDAVLAYEMGLAGIVLSNHGGRQLDFARSSIEVLEEVVTEMRKRNMFPSNNFQLFVDGGIRRGTDILKAVALGATAVGIGRPFLYAYSAYGPDGVVRAINLLHDEIEMNLRLIGAPTLKDVVPEMLDLRALHAHGSTVAPRDGSTVFDPHGHGRL
ncbi:L-lactate dehydrogenase [Malassezia pachydermatis]|uniref:L-lactate dehydrogenase (cytochrome) n=1 Tax=Malassezia pachydermatis TaxID=77020 RepID=A0A0N0RS65_9BASI|nr:cyb2-l-lactate dehydrogenase (cytochrome b2) [Malassezia pachydermatis]KOS14022.1 cyb2-l-lactate dehydrogenase (cytochrome b2) [Malassezia pachydermatis]